ncbi:MAG: pyrroloquinoline quinone (PQQ) biosynthesis protein C [Halieaceae bacterium]|jgi:pyrroloquinoline quinone (PQQ) biosynthesis protein C
MNFFDVLQNQTTEQRNWLMASPIMHKAVAGNMTLPEYVAYLCQAYHHVRHTVPLLMAAGSRLGPEQEWLRVATAEYIEEEIGHEQWILNDIEACGYDRERVINSMPNYATEIMVSYAYHVIDRVNPLGFFGMVHVLEGTSVGVADSAAEGIQTGLGLPNKAFSYLRSHGAIDVEHIAFFEALMNKISEPAERDLIVHCSRNFYRLFGGVLRSIEPEQGLGLAA